MWTWALMMIIATGKNRMIPARTGRERIVTGPIVVVANRVRSPIPISDEGIASDKVTNIQKTLFKYFSFGMRATIPAANGIPSRTARIPISREYTISLPDVLIAAPTPGRDPMLPAVPKIRTPTCRTIRKTAEYWRILNHAGQSRS